MQAIKKTESTVPKTTDPKLLLSYIQTEGVKIHSFLNSMVIIHKVEIQDPMQNLQNIMDASFRFSQLVDSNFPGKRANRKERRKAKNK